MHHLEKTTRRLTPTPTTLNDESKLIFRQPLAKEICVDRLSQDGGSINKLMNHMPVAMRKPKRSSLLLSFPAASCWLFVNLKASFYFTPTVMSSSSKQTSRFRYANRWTSITLACDLDKLYRWFWNQSDKGCKTDLKETDSTDCFVKCSAVH